MTPQLQMAIKLLQLSRLEMLDTIRQELEENPALEEVQESAPDENLPEQSENRKRIPPKQKKSPSKKKSMMTLTGVSIWVNTIHPAGSVMKPRIKIHRDLMPLSHLKNPCAIICCGNF